MTVQSYASKHNAFPEILPVFPLSGVLLLPRGMLPLNIFEPRYVAMVDAALKGDRLIGIIQPDDNGDLYKVGCAGRIISYNETPDGRYEIVLSGICRFTVREEIEQVAGYRRVCAGWESYARDAEPIGCLDIDRAALNKVLKTYFEQQGLTCSWEAVEGASDEKLMTSLAMICPLEAKEKQALLEVPCCKDRAQLFMSILEMAVRGDCSCRH